MRIPSNLPGPVPADHPKVHHHHSKGLQNNVFDPNDVIGPSIALNPALSNRPHTYFPDAKSDGLI